MKTKLSRRLSRLHTWTYTQWQRDWEISLFYHDGHGNVYAQDSCSPLEIPYNDTWAHLAKSGHEHLDVGWNKMKIKFPVNTSLEKNWNFKYFKILSPLSKNWHRSCFMGGRSFMFVARSQQGHYARIFTSVDKRYLRSLVLPYHVS